MPSIKILYRDRNAIVCVKEPGMLAELSGNSLSVPLAAKETLESMGEKNTDVFTVHRLDKSVGGLTVLARNSKAASYYTSLIQSGGIVKKYLAVIHGLPELPEGTYRNLLFRDAAKNKTYIVDRERTGVREAILDYKVISIAARAPDGTGAYGTVDFLGAKDMDIKSILTLVEITLITGRTHQIRAQFSGRGTPLYGDGRYGSGVFDRSAGTSQLLPALYAYKLSFTDMKGTMRDIKSLPPVTSFPWNLFNYSSL